MTDKTVAKLVIGAIVFIVLISGFLLLNASKSDNFENYKEVYQVVVVDSLVGPFEVIIAAFVALGVGKMGFTAWENKNCLLSGKDRSEIKKLGLKKINIFE